MSESGSRGPRPDAPPPNRRGDDTTPQYRLPEPYATRHGATTTEPVARPSQQRTPESESQSRGGRRWLRRTARTLLGGASVFGLLLGVSIVGALQTPGSEDFNAKWADWLRNHHADALVTPLENWYFQRQQPPTGGQPGGLNRVPHSAPGAPGSPGTPGTGSAAGGAGTGSGARAVLTHLPAPGDVPLIVQPGLPNEGRWQPTGRLADGGPGMYVAQFRADTLYTSQITTAVWIDPTRLRLGLVPGTGEPGGQWPVPPDIEGAARRSVVAAFNGGFRFKDAKGGFYLDGSEAVPLRPGAASIVIDRSGHVTLGAWGRDVGLAPSVEAVLQNLTLIVDHSQLDPAVSRNDTSAWGATIKGKIVVPRSGIGITANGALVYVAGPALSASSLADSLLRAGAVRAMTLDLNPTWVTFNFFEHPDPANPSDVVGAKLYPSMKRPAERYLTPDSRDFFMLSQR